MGFWGPTVKERNKGGRVVYYGKCDECRTEYEDTDKKTVVRKLNDCEKKDKKEKKKAAERAERERLDAVKDRQEAARAKAQEKKAEEDERKRKAMWNAKKQGMTKIKHLKRESQGYCAFCNSKPCKGKKPKCVKNRAVEMESLMDFDPTDPAQFDPQMKDWFK